MSDAKGGVLAVLTNAKSPRPLQIHIWLLHAEYKLRCDSTVHYQYIISPYFLLEGLLGTAQGQVNVYTK